VTDLVLDTRTRWWAHGRVVAGGSPWRLSMLAPSTAEIVRHLATGPATASLFDPRAVRALTARGLVHPLPSPPDEHPRMDDLTVAIPVFADVDGLRQALASLAGQRVIVVDDASANARAIAGAASEYGATLLVHERNLGPAAARNTAVAAASTQYIAFVDSDVTVTRDWPACALGHFTDATVALVAPRVTSHPCGHRAIDRYEAVHGALDMGPDPALVRPGARVGYVPGAAFVARTDVLRDIPFDESIRWGEDVDLVWRLSDAGRLVRYDPSAVVQHRSRAAWPDWMRQRYAYGTSATALAARHRSRLAPWRGSMLTATSLGLLAAGRPLAAVAPVAITAGLVHAGLRGTTPPIAAEVTLRGWSSEAAGLGHALRREWWPVGAAACLALALRPRSPAARLAVAAMAVPIVADWWKVRDRISLPHYTAMRVIDDTSYGTGVITAAIRDRSWRAVAPRVIPIRRRRGTSDRPGRAPSVGQ